MTNRLEEFKHMAQYVGVCFFDLEEAMEVRFSTCSRFGVRYDAELQILTELKMKVAGALT